MSSDRSSYDLDGDLLAYALLCLIECVLAVFVDCLSCLVGSCDFEAGVKVFRWAGGCLETLVLCVTLESCS